MITPILLLLLGAQPKPTKAPPVTTVTIRPCDAQKAGPISCLRLWADQLDGVEALNVTLILPPKTTLDTTTPVSTVMAAVGCLPVVNAKIPGQLSLAMACVDPRAVNNTKPQPLIQFWLKTPLIPTVAADRIGVYSCVINEQDGRCR